MCPLLPAVAAEIVFCKPLLLLASTVASPDRGNPSREVLPVYVAEFSRCSVCNFVVKTFTGGPSSLCCRVVAVQCLQLDRVEGTRGNTIYEGHA